MTSSSRLPIFSRWSLERALGDPVVQREIIHYGAASIAALKPAPTGLLFGEKEGKTEPAPRNLTVAQLIRTPSPPMLEPGSVAGYFQAVANHEQNPLVLTWAALVMMVLFRECAATVARASDPVYAPWFDGDHSIPPLEARFEEHIGGTATKLAKTGLLAVVAEWQLLARLTPFMGCID